MQQRRSIKKILITSTLAEEGKSFTSANLAVTLARKTDQRVLLIEGDLRRPVLSKKFGVGELPGLTEALAVQRSATENIYHLEDQKLWLLPTGSPLQNPLELMQSGQLAVLLEQLSVVFDWIVIDSPPLIPLADTILWSRLVDGVLLVARQGKTAKRPLKRALELIDRSTLLGVVLNSCSDSDHQNYYGRYGYGAGAHSQAVVEGQKVPARIPNVQVIYS
jgi:capsular exopolysaccharide synthesis family protein